MVWRVHVVVVVVLLRATATLGVEIPPLAKSGVVGVYNKTKYPGSLFRSDSARSYFFVWPEDYKATGCFCEDGTGVYSSANFTSSPTGNVLDPRPYYDVGLADAYRTLVGINQHFWALDTNRRTYPLRCEYRDLQALYMHRLHHPLPWMITRWTASFLAIFELVTFLSTAIFWYFPGFIIAQPDPVPEIELPAVLDSDADENPLPDLERGVLLGPAAAIQPEPAARFVPVPILYRNPQQRLGPRTIAFKWIVLGSFPDNLSDCLHMLALAGARFLLTENIGHGDIRGWRTMAFYNAGVLYEQIVIVVVVAAFLHQICLAWPSESRRRKLRDFEVELWRYYTDRQFHWWEYCRMSRQLLRGDPVTQMSDDWRWQRIFGQGSVILLTGTLLGFVEDNSGTSLDNMASLVLAAVVVACSWSVGVTGVSLFKSFFFLLEKIL